MAAWDYSKIMDEMRDALGTFQGNPYFGTTYADQWRNSNAGLGVLRQYQPETTLERQQFDALNSGLRSMRGNAIAGGVLTGLTGAANIAGNAMNAARLQDTTHIENQIGDLHRAGAYNYNNFDQLANDMANTNFGVNVDYEDIRGMGGKGVTKEKVGAVGGSALSGAASGMQIGGPLGAAIGGVIGAGAGLWGVLSGDAKARNEEKYLNLQAQLAQDAAQNNFEAAHERISDEQNRYKMVNAVATGGKIARRRQSIIEYANKVTKTPQRKEFRPRGIVGYRSEGGFVVRLNKK